jgi:hypothetical protein
MSRSTASVSDSGKFVSSSTLLMSMYEKWTRRPSGAYARAGSLQPLVGVSCRIVNGADQVAPPSALV